MSGGESEGTFSFENEATPLFTTVKNTWRDDLSWAVMEWRFWSPLVVLAFATGVLVGKVIS